MESLRFWCLVNLILGMTGPLPIVAAINMVVAVGLMWYIIYREITDG